MVELLVVIGIIALLIALLLPSLSAARRTAQRTACAAKLSQIMIAAQTHRNNHKDYYPLAGILPGMEPQTLSDIDTAKYDYLSVAFGGGITRPLCAITNALETEMSGSRSLNSIGLGILGAQTNDQRINAFLDPRGLTKNFVCPSEAASPLDIQPQYVLMYYSPSGGLEEPQSYIYNEYVLGWDDTLGRLKGKGSKVRQPALTMFAADGIGGPASQNRSGLAVGAPMYTVYNTATDLTLPVSLGDAFAGTAGQNGQPARAGDTANFDVPRHSKKINVAFCDGHVQVYDLTVKDLNKVWLKAP